MIRKHWHDGPRLPLDGRGLFQYDRNRKIAGLACSAAISGGGSRTAGRRRAACLLFTAIRWDLDMTGYTIWGSSHKRILFLGILAAAMLLTWLTALHNATPLDGIPNPEVGQMDTGWFYEEGGSLSPLEQLPCRLELAGDTLYLVHALSEAELDGTDVLAVQTRYQSIRVWADQRLIYEAAQGREHALSSMWHFVPAEACRGAAALRIELTRYEDGPEWELSPILQDHPDAIEMYLLLSHLPTILVWLCCMLFTLLLLFVVCFMAGWKIEGIPLILSLTAFIFLSGTWILLDSKLTTVFGGNYALTYFFSYCVFYLLPIPLLFYFQLMLEVKNVFLRYLLWVTAGNAGFWMLLHLLGAVSIRDTAISVHLIIITFLAVLLRALLKKRGVRRNGRLTCTFWGILLIFATALISILLYHAGLLPPTNSAVLYAWSLLALILCMLMDTVMMFGRVWKEKQYTEFYRQLATEDSMTKLANRNAYELRLRELVSNPPGEVGLILFDINRMKYINDTYGHHVGDQVIFLVAQCINEVFGYSGQCYRIGGDEFCVILTAWDDISQDLQRFDALVRDRNQHPFPVSVSHGWETRNFQVGKPVAFKDIIELKTASDQKLYQDKTMRGKA